LESDSVFDAYTIMYESSDSDSNRFHCKEFLDGYPYIRKLYENFDQEINYSESMSNLYNWALTNLPGEIPKGQIADALACVTFLALYLNDYRII